MSDLNEKNGSYMIGRIKTLSLLGLIFTYLSTGLFAADSLTLPLKDRPQWLRDEGIIMAGDWEPLLHRVRRDGGGYVPSKEQLELYSKEHTPEMIAKLKAIGVNFVMMHSYKGAGLIAEKESMQDAVKFSKMCHEDGMHVGVYNYSGAFLWELLFKEKPEAEQWVIHDVNGNPITYEGGQTYRYFWNRNHPAAQEYYKQIVKFAVEEIKTDLLHWDNYVVGPGYDACSVARFREYIKRTFPGDKMKELGIDDINTLVPPNNNSLPLLKYAWLEFSTESLTQSFCDMSKYAKSLRPDILTECNPRGVGDKILHWRWEPFRWEPVDHGRLLACGDAYWDESFPSGYIDGVLTTRIRNFKVGRLMNNITFDYTTTPLTCAEAIAFNLDCLGCVCDFAWGKIVSGGKPMDTEILPYIKFFRQRRDLLRNADVIADVAVLRSFPSQVFGDPNSTDLTTKVEQLLIENRVPFHIIYDRHLKELGRYKILVLARCKAMSASDIEDVKNFISRGGIVLTAGEVATHDEWMRPRKTASFSQSDKMAHFNSAEEILTAINDVYGEVLSFKVKAPHGVCAEFTQQGNRRLVHLVNYKINEPAKNIEVRMPLPSAFSCSSVKLASPQHVEEISLPFTQKNKELIFVVPETGIYEIASIELKKNLFPFSLSTHKN